MYLHHLNPELNWSMCGYDSLRNHIMNNFNWFVSGYQRLQMAPKAPSGASFQLFLGGPKFFFIFQCHRTIEKLEKTALYM